MDNYYSSSILTGKGIQSRRRNKNKTEKIMLMSGTSFDLNANVPFSQLHLLYEKIIYPTVLKDREQ